MYKLIKFLNGKKKSTWDNIQVSIIVSTGRTGTKYFANMFAKNQNFISNHEPSPIGNIEGFDFLKGYSSMNDLIAFLINARKNTLRLLNRESKYNYLESNGGLIFFIPFLNKIFPNLRIAHIIRNPVEFVRSGCSRLDSDSMGLLYLDDKNWLIKSTDLMGDKFYDKWNSMSMPERFMWIWNLKNKYALESSLKYDFIKSFRFEDVFQNNLDKLNLIKYLSFNENVSWVNDIDMKVNHTIDFRFPKYDDWNDELKEKLILHCSELMNHFKY